MHIIGRGNEDTAHQIAIAGHRGCEFLGDGRLKLNRIPIGIAVETIAVETIAFENPEGNRLCLTVGKPTVFWRLSGDAGLKVGMATLQMGDRPLKVVQVKGAPQATHHQDVIGSLVTG